MLKISRKLDMNESEKRQSIVQVMQGWIGRKESDGSHKEIIDIYNNHKPLAQNYKVKYTDSWCMTTTSAAYIQAGLADIFPLECSCKLPMSKEKMNEYFGDKLQKYMHMNAMTKHQLAITSRILQHQIS